MSCKNKIIPIIFENGLKYIHIPTKTDMISIGSEFNSCDITKADFSNDGLVDIIDIFAFATMLSEGQFDNE